MTDIAAELAAALRDCMEDLSEETFKRHGPGFQKHYPAAIHKAVAALARFDGQKPAWEPKAIGVPVAWWNGITKKLEERDQDCTWSVARAEDTNHDIPLIAMVNPCNLTSPPLQASAPDLGKSANSLPAQAQGLLTDAQKRVARGEMLREINAGALPIERDEDYQRDYIPMPGGWEIQTKGRGSSFRICNTKTGDRFNVCEERLHEDLELMAREVRDAHLTSCEAANRERNSDSIPLHPKGPSCGEAVAWQCRDLIEPTNPPWKECNESQYGWFVQWPEHYEVRALYPKEAAMRVATPKADGEPR